MIYNVILNSSKSPIKTDTVKTPNKPSHLKTRETRAQISITHFGFSLSGNFQGVEYFRLYFRKHMYM